MSKTFFTIAARVPLPDDRISAHKVEGVILAVAEKFRTEFLEAVKKAKIEGAEFETRSVRSKGPKTAKSELAPATTAASPATASAASAATQAATSPAASDVRSANEAPREPEAAAEVPAVAPRWAGGPGPTA